MKLKLIRMSVLKEQKDTCVVSNAGNNTLKIDNAPCDRGIKEVIRIINSSKILERLYKNKFKANSSIYELNARRQFYGDA